MHAHVWVQVTDHHPRPHPHQVHGVNKSALVLVVGQDLPQVRDVAGGQTQRVQLGQLGVRGHPGQGGLQSGEGFGQDPHSGSLPSICCVPLHMFALLLRYTLGRSFARRGFALLVSRRVACALAVGALLRALVGVFAELEDAVQELVVHIAKGAGGHGLRCPGAQNMGAGANRTEERAGQGRIKVCGV